MHCQEMQFAPIKSMIDDDKSSITRQLSPKWNHSFSDPVYSQNTALFIHCQYCKFYVNTIIPDFTLVR